jgi:palmitoyltransferase
VDFFLNERHENGPAITFLTLYFVFFLLTLTTYLRLFLVIQTNPGVTPLGPKAIELKEKVKNRPRRERDLEAVGRYEARPDDDPDSPGLELFYSKDVFVCETDGRPRWCSTCCNWKVDRAHHCSEIERCVRKMDHYCPWVGGIVGETCRSPGPESASAEQTEDADREGHTAFKFFVQFTFYTALTCIVVIVAGVICLQAKMRDGDNLDGVIIALLAIAAMFGLFTVTMTATSVRSILVNLTTVDHVKKANRVVHQLALRVPLGTPPGPNYNVITYPLPKPPRRGRPGQSATPEPTSPRDQLASRTYAIVKTEMGENPWDLGFWRNWTSVMGTNPLDWFLPINPSPCTKYESPESFYEMGPVYKKLRKRYGLPELTDTPSGAGGEGAMQEKKPGGEQNQPEPEAERPDEQGTSKAQ